MFGSKTRAREISWHLPHNRAAAHRCCAGQYTRTGLRRPRHRPEIHRTDHRNARTSGSFLTDDVTPQTSLQRQAIEGVVVMAKVADMGGSWGGGPAGWGVAGRPGEHRPTAAGGVPPRRQGRAETRPRWLISVRRLSTNQRTSEHLGSLISAPRLPLPRQKIAVVRRAPPKAHALNSGSDCSPQGEFSDETSS